MKRLNLNDYLNAAAVISYSELLDIDVVF